MMPYDDAWERFFKCHHPGKALQGGKIKMERWALLLLIIFLLVLLAGCAKRVYTHPYKTAQDFERDQYDCEKIAKQSAANHGLTVGIAWSIHVDEECDKCLRLKYGWQLQRP
jgi:hypothetical protein